MIGWREVGEVKSESTNPNPTSKWAKKTNMLKEKATQNNKTFGTQLSVLESMKEIGRKNIIKKNLQWTFLAKIFKIQLYD